MSCASAFIGPDHAGPFEILDAGRLGWVCDPFSPEALADAFGRVAALSDAEAYARRARADAACRSRYALQAVGPFFARAIRALEAGKSPSGGGRTLTSTWTTNPGKVAAPLETLITDAVVTFLGIARSVAAGTCDARGIPHGTRAAALSVSPDRQHVTLFIAEAIAAPMLRNVRETGRLAVQVSHPIDHRTLQLKGRATNVRAATEAEGAYVAQFVVELSRVLGQVGLPLERVQRMAHWPAAAIDLHVEEIYLQTPGPGAGQPLSGRAP